MAYPTLPSAEGMMVQLLKTAAKLVPTHGGRVGTKLNATLPALRVTRVGGVAREPWEDLPALQIECWAATDVTAEQLARDVVSVLPDFAHRDVTGGKLHTYELTSGPYRSDDDPDLSSNARYILLVQLVTST